MNHPGDRDEAPRILVGGFVSDRGRLGALGDVRRSRWSGLVPCAARWGADLVAVGRPPSGVDAVAVIARLKGDPATAATPVLHAAPADDTCPECPADVCLSSGSTPGQLARVAEALLELARARARRSGLYAARASLATGAASRPAP